MKKFIGLSPHTAIAVGRSFGFKNALDYQTSSISSVLGAAASAAGPLNLVPIPT
jgi:hypothetical protein